MKLQGKVAFVTGGARIGATVAAALAEKGCDVVLVYRRSREAARGTAEAVRAAGRSALVVRGDMTKPADVRRTIGVAVRRFGGIDVLVNMTSIYGRTPWKTLNRKTWKDNIDANLTSAYLTVLHAADTLRKRRGRVIHFSDWIAVGGRPLYKDFVPYYAAKSGLLGLVQAQALELAPRVLVNAVAPGPILPPAGMSRKARKAVANATPLRSWGGPAEIARAVVFFAETDFVTGECLRVDGGRHLS